MNIHELKLLFCNNTDCYAETNNDLVIPAMIEETFIDVVAPLLGITVPVTDPETLEHSVHAGSKVRFPGNIYHRTAPLTPEECTPSIATGGEDVAFEKSITRG